MVKWVYNFSKNYAEGNSSMKKLLGGKGANLAEMCNLGINVPPGCTIIAEACNYYFDNNHELPTEFKKQVDESIKYIENKIGCRFGDLNNPLLLSIRSGSQSSMPGMMDTILNLGLNDSTTKALAIKTGNSRFAYDSYRRFIQMYSSIVLEIDNYHFEEILELKKQNLGIDYDTDLSGEDLEDLVNIYKKEIYNLKKQKFPNDLQEILWNSIRAVFKSWHNQRAITYRKIHNIPDNWGTAVNIQAMVFGNMDNNSATGVAFTRDPSDGEKKFFGEYLINAQGEDVVSGIRTPRSITIIDKEINKSLDISMEESMNDLYLELREIAAKLETHYKDMQDIEFTIQEGKLWILQTRSGKRTANAAINIAVDLANENIITRIEAILRINPDSLNQLLHPSLDYNYNYKVISKGLPASPGAACGAVVFSAEEAAIRASNKQKVILVRTETSPEDINGMYVSEGILTTRGGMTSHAAVVARGMGKACICGANELIIDYNSKTISIGEITIKENDIVTINGSNGEIILGEVPTTNPNLSEKFQALLNWSNEHRKTKVRANAETTHDIISAKKFGCEGIGLCRTEHMFFNESRINIFREMIISSDISKRKILLDKLLIIQKNDFLEIFELMDNLPVNIRLLDPPLHEFLPHTESEIQAFSVYTELSTKTINNRILELKEQNPMLGHRGCRIGISHPEIYEMQIKAIFLAMIEAKKLNITPKLEIMIPFVMSSKELQIIKKLIDNNSIEIQNKYNINLDYKIGTMIELPKAALIADKMAVDADFFSFGTNDLTQTTLGISRDDSSSFLQTYINSKILDYDPFVEIDQEGIGELMDIAIKKARSIKNNIKLGICGEQAGNPKSLQYLSRFDLDYVSCSPYRIAIAKLALAQIMIKSTDIHSDEI